MCAFVPTYDTTMHHTSEAMVMVVTMFNLFDSRNIFFSVCCCWLWRWCKVQGYFCNWKKCRSNSKYLPVGKGCHHRVNYLPTINNNRMLKNTNKSQMLGVNLIDNQLPCNDGLMHIRIRHWQTNGKNKFLRIANPHIHRSRIVHFIWIHTWKMHIQFTWVNSRRQSNIHWISRVLIRRTKQKNNFHCLRWHWDKVMHIDQNLEVIYLRNGFRRWNAQLRFPTYKQYIIEKTFSILFSVFIIDIQHFIYSRTISYNIKLIHSLLHYKSQTVDR